MIILYLLFLLSAIMIVWANIGYPLVVILLGKIIKKENKKNYNVDYTVTLMIAAHNEEKVIEKKLENAISLDYPKNKFEILVTSDFSTDNTNKIVVDFIKKHNDYNIRLYKVKKRKGKTNAQNEAAKTVKSDILVMTDANSMIKKNAIKELVASFSDNNIVYVTGLLSYSNHADNSTSNNESTYWDIDTKIRDIESRIQTITAGNGALYACRTSYYYDFDPIKCHDSAMPIRYALMGKRAIANHDAIAYEKAGASDKDEFKRKVRMNRGMLKRILPSIRVLNVFKYKWFTIFYLGHRTSRYLLWFNHLLLLVSNIFLSFYNNFYLFTLFFQILVYILALLHNLFKFKNRITSFLSYYCMTVIAQIIGVIKTIAGKNKPFWEKAESTRCL